MLFKFSFMQPITNLCKHYLEDEPKRKFYNTPKGITRRRVGRGGRIVYDRLSLECKAVEDPEYKIYDINPTIECNRMMTTPTLNCNSATSCFSLGSICEEFLPAFDELEIFAEFKAETER